MSGGGSSYRDRPRTVQVDPRPPLRFPARCLCRPSIHPTATHTHTPTHPRAPQENDEKLQRLPPSSERAYLAVDSVEGDHEASPPPDPNPSITAADAVCARSSLSLFSASRRADQIRLRPCSLRAARSIAIRPGRLMATRAGRAA